VEPEKPPVTEIPEPAKQEDVDEDGVPDEEDAFGSGEKDYEMAGIGIGSPGTIGHGPGCATCMTMPDVPVERETNRSPEDYDWSWLDDVDNLPAAAAGPGYARRCEAVIGSPDEISLYCADGGGDEGNVQVAKVPVEGSLDETLNRLNVSLAGGRERIEIGAPETLFCVRDHEMSENGEGIFAVRQCPEWYRPLKDEAAAADAENFDSGRIAYHAPKEMVAAQPYVLELGIQPVTAATDETRADRTLRDTLGTGLAPGSTESPFALNFETVKASSLMAATIVASGFQVTGITPEEQAVRADAPTVWKWLVTPQQAGQGVVAFNLAQRLEENGERHDRVVKSIPLFVTVRTIDDLLASDEVAPGPNGPGARNALPNTLMSPALDAPPTGTVAVAADSGCRWDIGTNPDRFALVLSNLAYSPPISQLTETHEDGDRIAGSLKDTGFSVLRCRDLGRNQTLEAMRDVGKRSRARKLAGNHPVTFFYYSGHGVNVEDGNYVLPVDLPGANPEEIEDGAVSFEKIFNLMSTTVADTAFIVFDACRTVMDDDSRGMMRAYSPVTWSTGVFQAYATQPGKTAADSGTYSQELAATLPVEGLPANVVFKRVQDEVARKTENKQRPNYLDDTTGGEFYFRK